MFQLHKCQAGWPAGVWPEVSPKHDLVLRNKYKGKEDQEQGSEYLESGQRHIYIEPTPREGKVAESNPPESAPDIKMHMNQQRGWKSWSECVRTYNKVIIVLNKSIK